MTGELTARLDQAIVEGQIDGWSLAHTPKWLPPRTWSLCIFATRHGAPTRVVVSAPQERELVERAAAAMIALATHDG